MSDPKIKLTVKTSTGQQYSIEVEPSAKIEEVKQMLAEQSNIPADQQRLIYSGHILKNENSVDSYGSFGFLFFCAKLGSVFSLSQYHNGAYCDYKRSTECGPCVATRFPSFLFAKRCTQSLVSACLDLFS
jgi:hypothetical protein